jgi:hypothetical protein
MNSEADYFATRADVYDPGYGQALRAGGLGNQTAAEPEPLTVAVLHRLEMIAKLLGGADSCLASARERLFGPWPEAGSSQNSAKVAGPPSRRDELMGLLDHLTAQAQRVAQHAQVLNSSL